MKKTRIMAYVLLVAAMGCLSLTYGYRFMVGRHQKSVMMELQEWQGMFTNPDEFDAVRTIEMYEYASHYYIPGDGYYCSDRMSERLESQRQQTLDAFVAALQEQTGQNFGHDIEKWKRWAGL